MRQPPPHAAVAAAVLLLWLAVLTVAFHGCGGRFDCGGLLVRRASPVAVPRRMLLDVTSFDAAASPPTNHHHHHHAGRWNRHGVPPSPAGEEVDPLYGVEKRLVPTGPNPLHH
ncbi:hypothetical protein QOZ80_2BG0164980 [Eleusine coracana subsp. coracana]|nr:hypothetical protein QOZ80_2BG0164980 [Eleusine coracana subsp. coracana]